MQNTDWLKLGLNCLGAGIAGYLATNSWEGALAALGSALVALFQRPPGGR